MRGPNIQTSGGTVHASRGVIRAYGKAWPRALCGANRSVTVYLFETEEPVTCKRCLAKLETKSPLGIAHR